MSALKTIALAALLLPCLSLGQVRKDFFSNPENLKILPKDISSADLGATMKGFAMGLGLRCQNCHVGEAGKPLGTFDFAADDNKDMKLKARVMIAMVNEINSTFVPKLDKVEKAPRVEVRFVTCHRGQQQPKLIEDILDEELAANGIEAAVKRYDALRTEFYGSHSYDFSDFTLPMYAQGLSGENRFKQGVALAGINVRNFPDSYYSHFVLAEFQKADGQKVSAIASYQRAIEINPRAKRFIDPKIAELLKEDLR